MRDFDNWNMKRKKSLFFFIWGFWCQSFFPHKNFKKRRASIVFLQQSRFGNKGGSNQTSVVSALTPSKAGLAQPVTQVKILFWLWRNGLAWHEGWCWPFNPWVEGSNPLQRWEKHDVVQNPLGCNINSNNSNNNNSLLCLSLATLWDKRIGKSFIEPRVLFLCV